MICYLRAGSEEGQSVEKAKTGDTMAERERERGLSSAQIKRRAGLASITLLIGPHLFASRGV